MKKNRGVSLPILATAIWIGVLACENNAGGTGDDRCVPGVPCQCVNGMQGTAICSSGVLYCNCGGTAGVGVNVHVPTSGTGGTGGGTTHISQGGSTGFGAGGNTNTAGGGFVGTAGWAAGGAGGGGGSAGSAAGWAATGAGGGGGSAGSAASAGIAGGSTGGTQVSGPVPTIPTAKETCPQMAGLNATIVNFLGSDVMIWSGNTGTKGPMVFYWHGTMMPPEEAEMGLGPGTGEVVASGGVIASFITTNGTGTNTGDLVWFTGDFDTADEILACANQQGLIDLSHIHTAGYSAGGLQAGAMVYERGYLASFASYSGGVLFPGALPDPTNHPALLSAHGAVGLDAFIIDLATTTINLANDLKAKGCFVIDCDDGGDHVASMTSRMASAGPAAWQFFKDHPYKVNPEPYTSLPPNFPTSCKIL